MLSFFIMDFMVYSRYMTDIVTTITPILQEAGVTKAALFGSFARGEQTTTSDVDILIEFGGNKNLFDLIELKDDLKTALHRNVDVVTYNSLHPLLRDRIINEQQPIYG